MLFQTSVVAGLRRCMGHGHVLAGPCAGAALCCRVRTEAGLRRMPTWVSQVVTLPGRPGTRRACEGAPRQA